MHILALLAVAWLIIRWVRRSGEASSGASGGGALGDDQLRPRLSGLGLVPPELRAPTPRPDVFSGRGYLREARHRDLYLHLLRNGRASRALCVAYDKSWDTEGPDVKFTYAWLDDHGKVRRATVKESYDSMHAGLSSGQGSIVVDMDANMHLGKAFTVVYWPDAVGHVVYEALLLDRPAR